MLGSIRLVTSEGLGTIILEKELSNGQQIERHQHLYYNLLRAATGVHGMVVEALLELCYYLSQDNV